MNFSILLAWSVHVFTASGACFALFALRAIAQHDFKLAFCLMGAAVVIDGVDGFFARALKVKTRVPQIDGALLDNLVDFLNYCLVPAYFIIESNLVPAAWRSILAVLVIMACSYQFTQRRAKTEDHFFTGFPSYWNFVVYYLYFWDLGSVWNGLIVVFFTISSFIPIKYIYLSRLDNFSPVKAWRVSMHCLTMIWGLATLALMSSYSHASTQYQAIVGFTMAYVIFYHFLSVYKSLDLARFTALDFLD